MENKIYYIFFFLTALLSGCIEDPEFSKELTGGGKPVFKDGMTLIGKTASSIEFSAEILKENGYKIMERGFVWSTTSQNPVVENGNTIKDTGTGIGTYTCKLEGLSGSTKYYIRPYAINEQGIEYGSPGLAIQTEHGLGIVTTNKPDSVHAALATVGGTIVDAGEGEIISRGVYYYSEAESYLTKDSVMSADVTDIYQCKLTNLSPSTKYYCIAFVTNTFGTFEGMIDSLTTKNGLVEIGVTGIINIGYNDVKLSSLVSNSYDTTVQIIERGFCWGLNSTRLTINDDTVQVGAGSGYFEKVIENLISQEQYYARAYARTLYGVVYSETIEFYTKSDLPTVRTDE
ncbi:MAG: hypothetical protein LBT24_05720, partial [Tannerella sp.]|nr:hypothetical protein [Tannerella sp.]